MATSTPLISTTDHDSIVLIRRTRMYIQF